MGDTVGVRTDSSRWTRPAVVAVYAAAMAVVEAMVVFYLRRLFALQYAAVFTPGRFSFPHAYLRHEQIREAATIVMLVAVACLAGRGLAAEARLLSACLRHLGHRLLRGPEDHARLAGVARYTRPAVPHAAPVVGAGVGTTARLVRVHRRRPADHCCWRARRATADSKRDGRSDGTTTACGSRPSTSATGSPSTGSTRGPFAGGRRPTPSPASTATSSVSRRSTAFSRGTCSRGCRTTHATGVGRTDGRRRGERCAVLYRHARLALDELGHALVFRHARRGRLDELGQSAAARRHPRAFHRPQKRPAASAWRTATSRAGRRPRATAAPRPS